MSTMRSETELFLDSNQQLRGWRACKPTCHYTENNRLTVKLARFRRS